jgi:hypothetical protein
MKQCKPTRRNQHFWRGRVTPLSHEEPSNLSIFEVATSLLKTCLLTVPIILGHRLFSVGPPKFLSFLEQLIVHFFLSSINSGGMVNLQWRCCICKRDSLFSNRKHDSTVTVYCQFAWQYMMLEKFGSANHTNEEHPCWNTLSYNTRYNATMGNFLATMGNFKFGLSACVYCTKCTLNTSVNTNIEITHCIKYC